MSGRSVVVFFLFVVWGILVEQSPASSDPGVLFHLPLEGSLNAEVAQGNGMPLEATFARFVPGMRGQGVLIEKGGGVKFAEPGNLRKDRGTLMFWVRPSWDISTPGNHYFFREDSVLHSGNNVFSVINFTGWVEFVLDDKEDHWRKSRVFWKGAEWHHVAVTWDHTRGAALYLDGRMQSYNLHDGIHIESPFSWDTCSYDAFLLGDMRGANREPGFVEGDVVLDEFRIFDSALTPEEIKDTYCEEAACPEVYLPWNAFEEERGFRLRIRLLNPCRRESFRGRLDCTILDDGGEERFRRRDVERTVEVKGGGVTEVLVPLPPLPQGRHDFQVSWNGDQRCVRKFPLWFYPTPEERSPAENTEDSAQEKILARIDCVKERRPEWFCSEDTVKVARTEAGEYLEGGSRLFSRMAFRFAVKHPHRPHEILVRYPDDEERVFDMIVNGPRSSQIYDVGTGVYLGGEYPPSKKMQDHSILFWPREEDNAISFMNWEKGKRVAVSEIVVKELSGGLPPLTLDLPSEGVPRRQVGLYWEDPRFPENLGWQGDTEEGFDRAVTNLLSYMRHMGMNVLIYPTVTYGGPLYASEVEGFRGSNRFGTQPLNYVEILLSRCEEGEVDFYALFNIGATINLIDKVEADRIRTSPEALGFRVVTKEGETPRRWGEAGMSLFHPLHPVVQKEMRDLFEEHVLRFGRSPAFRGIAFHLVIENLTWLGALDRIYDDDTVRQFEKETGRSVPVHGGDKERFRARYDWIMKNAKTEWIRWRCAGMKAFYESLVDVLRRDGMERELVLSVFMPCGNGMNLDRWSAGGETVEEILLQAGFDVDLLGGIPGLRIHRFFHPGDYRLKKAHRVNGGMDPLGALPGRDLFFDPEALAPFQRNRGNTGVNLFQIYFESRQGQNPFPGFWWDLLGANVSTVTAGHVFFMEYPAHALASLDPWLFTFGGFQIPTIGKEAWVRPFIKGLRSLPAIPFQTVAGMEDPVVMRYASCGGKTYLYLVNRESFPVRVVFTLDVHPPGLPRLWDLIEETGVEGEVTEDRLKVGFEMDAYGLRAFRVDTENVVVRDARQKVSSEIDRRVRVGYETLKKKVASTWRMAARDGKIERTLSDLAQAFQEEPIPYSRIHHLLQRYEAQQYRNELE